MRRQSHVEPPSAEASRHIAADTSSACVLPLPLTAEASPLKLRLIIALALDGVRPAIGAGCALSVPFRALSVPKAVGRNVIGAETVAQARSREATATCTAAPSRVHQP